MRISRTTPRTSKFPFLFNVSVWTFYPLLPLFKHSWLMYRYIDMPQTQTMVYFLVRNDPSCRQVISGQIWPSPLPAFNLQLSRSGCMCMSTAWNDHGNIDSNFVVMSVQTTPVELPILNLRLSRLMVSFSLRWKLESNLSHQSCL